jgi:hypothetical protein
MWRADESGSPLIYEGDLHSILFKLLWNNVAVDPKKNIRNELIRACKSIEKKNFIINGITKYIQLGNLAWYKMPNMWRRYLALLPIGS